MHYIRERENVPQVIYPFISCVPETFEELQMGGEPPVPCLGNGCIESLSDTASETEKHFTFVPYLISEESLECPHNCTCEDCIGDECTPSIEGVVSDECTDNCDCEDCIGDECTVEVSTDECPHGCECDGCIGDECEHEHEGEGEHEGEEAGEEEETESESAIWE
jgi:hypothetical protein